MSIKKAGFLQEHWERFLLVFYNSIQEYSAVYCKDELNADMSSSFGGCHKPYKLFFEGKKKDAADLVIYTSLWLFAFVFIFLLPDGCF